jgi:PiT family inorganic phosphate transporter
VLIALIVAAVLFGFLNGLNASASVAATAIASRAMSARRALTIAAVAEFIGPFVFGVAVADTLGRGLLAPQVTTVPVVLAGVIGAIVWIQITLFLALPSSSSHALVGGLIGAALAEGGLGAVQLGGLLKILAALFISPPLGFLAGLLLMRLILRLLQSATPRINDWLRRLQLFTSIGLALSLGANESQKTMGLLVMGLVASGQLLSFEVPLWVIVVAAAALSLGTLFGGLRLIRTLGGRITLIRPVHGFTTHAASSLVIIGAALLGGPVSTTQVISTTIMGVGSAERLSKVRWDIAEDMIWAWGLTIPATMAVGAGVLWLLRWLKF